VPEKISAALPGLQKTSGNTADILFLAQKA
jgi:hypothetical protein